MLSACGDFPCVSRGANSVLAAQLGETEHVLHSEVGFLAANRQVRPMSWSAAHWHRVVALSQLVKSSPSGEPARATNRFTLEGHCDGLFLEFSASNLFYGFRGWIASHSLGLQAHSTYQWRAFGNRILLAAERFDFDARDFGSK